jgi:hypothetical protein
MYEFTGKVSGMDVRARRDGLSQRLWPSIRRQSPLKNTIYLANSSSKRGLSHRILLSSCYRIAHVKSFALISGKKGSFVPYGLFLVRSSVSLFARTKFAKSTRQ